MTPEEITAALEAMESRLDAIEQTLAEINAIIGDLPVPVEPEPEPGPEPQPLPPEPAITAGAIPKPIKEVKIKTAAELRAALAGRLDPGTHLVLQKGDKFSGAFTMADAGTPKDPIFVRGAKGAAVPVTGNFLMRAPSTAIAWLEFAKLSGTRVDIGAKACRVTRCLFDQVRAGGIVYFSGRGHGRSLLDYNDFVNISGPILRSELQGAMEDHRGTRVERNHVNGHSVYGDNEAVAMMQTSEFKDIDLDYLYNLFQNCLKGATNQRELLCIKTSGGRVKGNTILNSNRGYISLRTSSRYVIEDNWLEDGSYINIHGDDHVVRNCRASGKLVDAQRGTAYSGPTIPKGCAGAAKSGKCTIDAQCTPAHAGARRLLVEDSVGGIEIGDRVSSRELGIAVPKGIVLRRNSQKAKVTSGEGVVETEVGKDKCTARRLTAGEVGRDA